MMEIFWKVFIMLFVFPVVISLYAAAVHFLGAFIVRISPRWLVRIFAIKLWTTEFDKGRAVNRIALQAEDKLNKRFDR
ncbi:hypothetical protein [Xylella fastidiosa]|uniref:hypothetical protein n=2 Tax=Xylella fastidiosa TaxID=2371 RepID=UPI0012923049|nr:hypothetical protein [Xylella fastidiosa]QIQ62506.1 hypothetical protein [Xylella phage Xfas53]MBE0269667.1 hypothetical protein [Xylella fastidiosa subsp. multiplex]MBE0282853.1 hypothetical protein [Xylella fastidiosa subsp. multiplex]MRT34383.1 hypothetical protein [Xylella fastidiosa subsp. multiplex]MRT46041.1 hypothetical protein [Xylella fastidiosa subsp. multiplex]